MWWAGTPQIPSPGPPEAEATLFCACVTEWNTPEAAWTGVAGVRPPRAATYAQVTKDGDPTAQLCSKEAGFGLSGRMCVITRDSREEADTVSRGHWRERALQTEKRKWEWWQQSHQRPGEPEGLFQMLKGKKKTTSHSSKSVHSEIVFKNGEIKAFQTNRSWENQISVGVFYKKCKSKFSKERDTELKLGSTQNIKTSRTS